MEQTERARAWAVAQLVLLAGVALALATSCAELPVLGPWQQVAWWATAGVAGVWSWTLVWLMRHWR